MADISLNAMKEFKNTLDTKMSKRVSAETGTVPIIALYLHHTEEHKHTACEIDERNSLTRIWCNKHNSAQYSCKYNNNETTFNSECVECCRENKSLMIQFD